MATRMNMRHRRDQRREDAEARNAAYAKLSPKDKLATLPEGGAAKQRARMEKNV